MSTERYIFFSGLDKKAVIDYENFDFDKDMLPICFADTKVTANDVKWEAKAIQNLRKVMQKTSNEKMFSGHGMDFFSFGAGSRDPADWVANIDLDTLKVIQTDDENYALIGYIKVLSGTEKREALRSSIKQAPKSVDFSVDVAVSRKDVKYIKSGDKIIQVLDSVAGYNSTDWVTYGAAKDAGLLFQKFSKNLSQELEEVKTMKFNEFKELHPDEYTTGVEQIKQELSTKFEAEKADAIKQAVADALKNQPKDQSDEIKALRQQLDTVVTERKEDSKQLAIMKEEKRMAQAATIKAELLKASKLPKTLWDKVEQHVNYADHVKDDVLDEAAFRAAFSKEIEDWENRMPEMPSVVIGQSFIAPTKEEETQFKQDVDYGKKVFEERFGKKNKK